MSETIDLTALDDARFEQLYAERIKPCFEEHEPERIAAVATFKQRLTIGLPIVVVIFLAVGLAWSNWGVAFILLIAGGIGAWGFAYIKLAAVQEKVKIASCSAVAQSIGVSFTLKDFSPPAFDRFRRLNILPNHDRSKFEDLFHGAYQTSGFDLYEAHLEKRHRDSKGRTSYTTAFRGQVIRLSFPREFLGITVVRRDAGVFNVFGGGKDLKRVGLESNEFERIFEVWGTDQVEARYLVHPMLMQRLLDLETSFKGRNLRCAFEQGDLLIAVEGGNLFEPGDMFKPLADPARARKLVDEIASILRVMDAVITAQAKRS